MILIGLTSMPDMPDVFKHSAVYSHGLVLSYLFKINNGGDIQPY